MPDAFDDAGQVVPWTGFDYDAVDGLPALDDAARSRQEITARLLAWLCRGMSDPYSVGRRALLLNHVVNRTPRLQSELAEMLGVSPSAVSQALTDLRDDLRTGFEN